MFDFPANPTLDQVYTQGGVSYKWNGYAWMMTSGGAGVSDGDKGDIIVSGAGTVWTFDTTVVTPAAKTVLDDATTAAMLTTLGGITQAEGDTRYLTQAAGDTRYVNTSGDTMNGNLVISGGTQPYIELNKQAGGVTVGSAQALGTSYGNKRWLLELGNADPEYYVSPPREGEPEVQTGTPNAGSNFAISRYLDSGALIDTPLKIDRLSGIVDFAKNPTVLGAPLGGGGSSGMLPLTGGTLTGNLTISKASPVLVLQKTGPSDVNAINFRQAGLDGVTFLDNSDGNFYLQTYNNAGAWASNCVTINRAAGTVSLGPTTVASLSATGYSTFGASVTLSNGALSAVNNRDSNYALQGSGGAQTGGCLGYNAGNTLYGIVGYGSYAYYGAGTSYTSQEFQANGYVRSLSSGAIFAGIGTTASSSNTNCTTGGALYRSTSSAAYKAGIEPLWDEYADKVLLLQPIFFYPNEKTVDRTDWSHFGFSAEQCHEVDPRFASTDTKVLRDENGRQVIDTLTEMAPNPDHGQWLLLSEEAKSKMAEPPLLVEIERPNGNVIYIEGEYEHHAVDIPGIVAGLVNLVQRMDARIKTLEAALGAP